MKLDKVKLLALAMIIAVSIGNLTQASNRVRAQGEVYYVSPTGKDTNPGTLAQPWKSIQHAADTLVAGNTVYIRAGTYHERVVPANSGSAGNVITYAAYSGEVVTINGSGVDVPEYTGLFYLEGRNYIRVSGLRVINSAYYGIVADTSGYITFDNNFTYNTYSSGISTWGCHNVIVDHNEVTGSNAGPFQESISISNTDTFEVRYNLVHDPMPGTNGKEGITIKDASMHGKVYGNLVYNLNEVGIYVDAEAGHLFDVEVSQNVVHDIEAIGISLASEQGGLLENIHLYNNISYDNLVGLWLSACCIATHPFKNITIINNTFAYNGRNGWGSGIAIENSQIQNVVIRNNIVSQNISGQMNADPSLQPKLTVDHNLTDGDRDTYSEFYGLGDLVDVSPSFVNPSGGNFHLGSASPAIDSGSSLGAPATDCDGDIRPQDGDGNGTSLYDIGADELAPAFTISGNAGVGGAALSYILGSPRTARAGAGGYYAFTVSTNWSGMVRPSKPGYTFSPPYREYTNVLVDQTAQNYTVTSLLQTTTFRSVGANDGWILESNETSNQGGTLNATGATFYVGDAVGDKQYRSILSFNTSILPEAAVITRVTLKFKGQSVTGVIPFTTHGNLLVDVYSGAFSGSPALQLTDFQALPSKASIGFIPKTSVSGWYTKVWTSGIFPYINKLAITQFRLRFTKDDNEDGNADILKFFSGNYAIASARPMLIVEYYVP